MTARSWPILVIIFTLALNYTIIQTQQPSLQQLALQKTIESATQQGRLLTPQDFGPLKENIAALIRQNPLYADHGFQRFKPLIIKSTPKEIKFTPDNKQLIGTFTDGLRTFDPTTGKASEPFLSNLITEDSTEKFDPHGQTIVVKSDNNTLVIIDLATKSVIHTIKTNAPVKFFNFSNNGSFLNITTEDNTITIYDINTAQAVSTSKHTQPISFVRPSKDNAFILVGFEPLNSIIIIETRTGKTIATFKQEDIREANISDNGTTAYAVHDNNKITTIEIPSGRIKTLSYQNAIENTAINPNGSTIAVTFSEDKGIILTTIATEKHTPLELKYDFLEMWFSPDGSRLFAVDTIESSLYVIDLITNKTLKDIDFNKLNEFEFSPDGSKLALGIKRGIILVIVQTGNQLRLGEKYTGVGGGYSVTFSPDSSMLAATTAKDETLILGLPITMTDAQLIAFAQLYYLENDPQKTRNTEQKAALNKQITQILKDVPRIILETQKSASTPQASAESAPKDNNR